MLSGSGRILKIAIRYITVFYTIVVVSEDILCQILIIDINSEVIVVIGCVQDAIRQLFSTDSSETSVRSQVCNVICLLVTTIHQIYAVFYAGNADASQPGVYPSLIIVIHKFIRL